MDLDQLYTNVKIGVGKAATKFDQVADVASQQIKLAAAEQKMQDAYILLGRMAYRHAVKPSAETEADMAKAVKIVAAARKTVRQMRESISSQNEKQDSLSAPEKDGAMN